MSRVLLVELEADLAQRLTSSLEGVGYEVAAGDAADVIKRLISDGPELAVVNLELTSGSGFSLVNRIKRNEALAGLKLVLVAEKATDAAIDTHRRGPTPASAYVRRTETMSNADFAAAVIDGCKRVLAEHLPEVAYGDLVALDAPASAPVASAATTSTSTVGATEKKPKSFEAVIGAIGSYRVLRRMRDEDGGAVFACRDAELSRDVAIKLMKLEGNDAEREEREKRFQREGRILALLHSAHIVAVYGAGTKFGIPFLVRELIDGESLADQIARDGPLDDKTALLRVRETARGLRHAALADIIHRDVRPENIHVVDGHAKIARFSMGKRADDPRITRGGLKPLDMTFVAPERVRGQEDLRGDIYALGVTLFTLIAGKPPYANPTCVDLITAKLVEKPMALDVAKPGASAHVAALVARMIDEDPAKRPQTYDDLLAQLDATLRVVDEASSASSSSHTPIGEPSAVMGTLRLMSVVEIVQSLELARKTAVVSIPTSDGVEGKLAFDAGRLVHASFGAHKGDDAFFALVARKDGAFRVDYDTPSTLEKNIDTPVTGLLLEAARRADTAARAPDPLVSSVSGAVDRAFFDPSLSPSSSGASTGGSATSSSWSLGALSTSTPMTESAVGAKAPAKEARKQTKASADEEDDVALAFGKKARTVHPVLGFLLLGATTSLFVYGGMHASFITSIVDPDVDADLSAKDVAALIGKTRKQAQDARASLAAVQPKLAELEASQASSAEATEAMKKRLLDARTSIETALKPDVDAHKVAVRAADDGSDVVIEIPESTLFTSDGDDVTGDGKAELAHVASAIAALGSGANAANVRVEGHTDDTEPKKSGHKNNWGLSGARATSTAKALVQQGVSSSHTKAIAMADSVPLASNRNAKGRARNRRIEIHVAFAPTK